MKHCPKCTSSMYSERKNGVTIDKCNSCGGLFLEFTELKSFIDGVSDNHTVEGKIEIIKGDSKKDHPDNKYKCAGCDSEMHEREFNYGSGIHIDFCKGCGATFLGESELKQILDFEYTRKYSYEWEKARNASREDVREN